MIQVIIHIIIATVIATIIIIVIERAKAEKARKKTNLDKSNQFREDVKKYGKNAYQHWLVKEYNSTEYGEARGNFHIESFIALNQCYFIKRKRRPEND